VDLIGQSIYDYCHPCDHDELREVLSLRPDGELARSFFLRLKSTLTAKGRSNNNLKAASYKVWVVSSRPKKKEKRKTCLHFLMFILVSWTCARL
jgi:hypoxia-inducible factor 1 alpha